ncbi:SRPBCC family protein [Flagellimonas meridianipacifica]|uniref:Polyketide cyclase/dehydrase/lipid transport protein n=1 Tax=Flagellimonas meridianipacifica TaxID=1080225 RepID=A0A2T0M8Y0_9FLAO|nr:SRPBCC family protein [Allomuricauda pacifica]PRX53987.1 polyketide cyclase/dehydrase/lipid transport protein [Allomuricauda pacifica]
MKAKKKIYTSYTLIALIAALMLIPGSSRATNVTKDKKKKPNVAANAEIFIKAPAKDVWAVFAEDFAGIQKWSSGVSHSEGFGEAIGSSPYSVRACEITAAGFGDAREEILNFNEDDYEIRYALYEAIPGFVKDFINTWKFREQDGGTYVSAQSEMRATGVMGFMMKGIMKGATRKALESMCEELKYYIENGEPHPEKVASNEKIATKDAKMKKKVVSFEIVQEIDAPVDRVWEVIGEGFADIANSNPDCPKSEWFQGHTKAELGAKRIMYMKENEKKYFIDKIAKWEPENHHITIEVIKKKGFPINADYTWVNMDATSMGPNKTRLKIRMNYLTKPRLLKGMAKGNLKKTFQRYAYAIDYHSETGENVTRDKWKEIKGNYK